MPLVAVWGNCPLWTHHWVDRD